MFCRKVFQKYISWPILCGCIVPLSGWAAEVSPGAARFGAVPEEFEAYFFDVPLAVRVELDQRYLGDALIVLSRDETVQLIEFTETQESRESPALRALWQRRLANGRPLGRCMKECPDGLQAVHYSLVESQLSLVTSNAEKVVDEARFYQMPEDGSLGLMLRNQLNLTNDGRDTNGRLAFQGQGSIGNWTTLADAQFDRVSQSQDGTQYRVSQLYAERLLEENFFRLGYFTPGAQGLVRQPRTMGGGPDTTLGVMFGSSDTLLIDKGQASTTPIYVTPNRPGVAEIYRDGVLINSQPVQPGLQTLDSRVLPGGIYEVEVRLLEDGQETSRTQAFIYKPSSWRNTDKRWRYNVYLGEQAELLNSWNEGDRTGFSAGIMSNYLLHPSAIVGLSALHVNETMQYATSLDWDVLDRLKFYGNVNYTENSGNGYDLQLLHRYDQGSVVLSHNQSWIDISGYGSYASRQMMRSQSSVSLNHRLTDRSTATLRLSQSAGAASGMGIDLGWAFYGKMLGTDTSWRLSLFDRPASASSGEARSRGVNLSMSMNLGGDGKYVSASVGSRTSRDGGSDRNASIAYQQDVDLGVLRNVGANASFDRYGTGFGGDARFESQNLFGDAYVQSSSYNNALSGGVNLESVLAVGDGKMAMSGQRLTDEAGVIVDVETDIEGLKLSARDVEGPSATLRKGRNVVPVTAFKSGYVQLDFDGGEAPAAAIQPSTFDYHLNRGGVDYQKVRVLRTVTVLGRLLDENGQPLRGAHVINHASRSVSEADGYFTVEMSESTPTLEIRQAGKVSCLLALDPNKLRREGDVLMVGDQKCSVLSVVGHDNVLRGGA